MNKDFLCDYYRMTGGRMEHDGRAYFSVTSL